MRVAGCVCPIIVQQKLNPLVFQHGRAFRLVKLAHCPNKIPVFIGADSTYCTDIPKVFDGIDSLVYRDIDISCIVQHSGTHVIVYA